MILTPSSLAGLTVGYRKNFNAGLMSAPDQWSSIAMEVQSGTASTSHPFLGDAPVMREWIGPRTVKNLEAFDYTLVNKKYESTVAVKKTDIEDDQFGLYGPRMEALGEAAGRLPEQLVFAALIAGGSELCYDGQYFFDTDHPVGGGTAANLITSSALTEATYATARKTMLLYTSDNGTPLNINPRLLVVPPSLEKTARQIVEADNLSVASGSTQSNVYKGSAQVLVVPRLEANSATTWYLMDDSKSVKPLIWQSRIKPEFQPPSMNQAQEFENDLLIYGTRARGVAGFGLWQLALKATA